MPLPRPSTRITWIFRAGGSAAILLALFLGAFPILAQDNYEIQVYGSETVAPGATMLETHSNFMVQGIKELPGGVLSSHHAFHETLELTHGFTDWFETGVYVFTSVQPGRGWEWVGDHLRPRVRIPERWQWPVGLSLSTEIGFKRRIFSENTWNWEIRPIIDKGFGDWYVAVNPAFGKAIHGPDSNHGLDFSPSLKVSYKLTKAIAAGFEHYAVLGPATRISRLSEQEHQFFPTLDLDLSSNWEVNFGVGVGLTHRTDPLTVKLILGRRF